MTRPPVSVVMPFAGSRAEADGALAALRALDTGPGDELILADNSGVAPADERVTVVPATGEQSPSHARNAGAARASRDLILFLDADCRAPGDLLELFFRIPVAEDVGALAGAVVPTAGLGSRPPAGRSLWRRQELPGPGRAPGPPFHAARGCRQPARAPGGVRSRRRLLRRRARRRGHGLLVAPAARRVAAGGSVGGRGGASLPHHRARAPPPVAGLRRRAGVAGPPLRGLCPRAGADARRSPAAAQAGRRARPSARANKDSRGPDRRASPRGHRRPDVWTAAGSWPSMPCSAWRSWPALRSRTDRAARPGRRRAWCSSLTGSPPATIRWPTSPSRWRVPAWRPPRVRRRSAGAPRRA